RRDAAVTDGAPFRRRPHPTRTLRQHRHEGGVLRAQSGQLHRAAPYHSWIASTSTYLLTASRRHRSTCVTASGATAPRPEPVAATSPDPITGKRSISSIGSIAVRCPSTRLVKSSGRTTS